MTCSNARGQGQIADNDRGFPVNATFATSGIDNVNLFNQSLVLSLPIGPEYPIGAGFTHQLGLAYNSLIWHPTLACQTSDPINGIQDHNGVYVSGSPLLGAGWALNLGSLHSRPNSSTPGDLYYVAPDGATHRIRRSIAEDRTKDGSFFRARSVVFAGAAIQSAEIDFPDGSVGVFDQVSTPSTIQHGPTYRDFVSEASYLRELRNPFGDRIVVNYETVSGVHRIQNIQHYGQGFLLRTLSFNYATLVVNTAPSGGTTSASWTVLDSIALPAAHSGTQTIQFTYHANGFDRPGTDNTADFCTAPADRSSPEVAAPLLSSIVIAPGHEYRFEYVQQLGSLLGKAGVMRQLELPTKGVVQYQWDFSDEAGSVKPIGFAAQSSCPPLDPACYLQFIRDNITVLTERREYPEGLSGPVHAWRYGAFPPPVPAPTRGIEVTAPDNYRTQHTFFDYPGANAFNQTTGKLVQVEHLSLSGAVVRHTRSCYEADSHPSTLMCSENPDFRLLSGNLRESLTEETAIGPPDQTRRTERSGWNGYGHFANESVYGWDGFLARTVMTSWEPPSGSLWLLNLYNEVTETEGATTTSRRYHHDLTNGFLRGTSVYDSGYQGGVTMLNCRYTTSPPSGLTAEFSARYPGSDLLPSLCATSPYDDFSAVLSLNVLGKNDDGFGKMHTYQEGGSPPDGLLRTTRWVRGTSTLGWPSADFRRDAATGAVLASVDPNGLSTGYSYDALGRRTQVGPPGETPTAIAYSTPAVSGSEARTMATATRAGGTGLSTYERYVYDGFGRLKREIRRLTGTSYSFRLRRYDSVGRESFVSEWKSCGNPDGDCLTLDVTLGTTSSQFDPLGRPQLLTRADGTTTEISYADGAVAVSDTRKKVRLNNLCVGGPGCPGGTFAETTYRYDFAGRVQEVIEPGGDSASYTYDVNGKVRTVQQGNASAGWQGRTFIYDRFGSLRSETTPEKGTVTYSDYGSLGNPILKTEGGIPYRYLYRDGTDRLSEIRAGAPETPYVTNCYDGGNCHGEPDNQPGFSGGTRPLGKLTRRIGRNPESTGGPVVTEDFTYSSPVGGRLSRKETTVTGTPVPMGAAVQTWSHNSLGLPASYGLPRIGGEPDIVGAYTYDNGLPRGLSAGATLVSLGTYHPAGNLSSWKAGNSLTTTVEQAASLIARPSRILTSNGVFDRTYTYDGDGNVLTVGPDSFYYDARSRLVSSTVSGFGQTFSYDPWGNRSGTASSATNRLTSGTYDARGNLTSFGGQTYSYDALSRQTSLNGGLEKYIYDGAGERIAKISFSSLAANFFTLTPCRVFDTRDPAGPYGGPTIPANTSRDFTLIGRCGIPGEAAAVAGNITVVAPPAGGHFELLPGGTTLGATSTLNYPAGRTRANNFNLGLSGGRLTLFSSATADAILDVSGYYAQPLVKWTLTFRDEANRISTTYEMLPSGTLTRLKNHFYFGNLLVATRDTNGALLYYHSDHLGTPRLVTKASGPAGGTLETHNYAPFGEEVGGAFGNQPLKFASMERDASSGKDYVHARYSSPTDGRFLSPDLVSGHPEDPRSWNRYVYVLHNPVRNVDPTGLITTTVVASPREGLRHAEFVRVTAPELNRFERMHLDLARFAAQVGAAFRDNRLPAFYQDRAVQQFERGNYLAAVIDQIGSDILPTNYLGAEGVGFALTLAGRPGVRVTFGHGGRHLANTGLSQKVVEAVIRNDLAAQVAKSSTSGNFWGKVVVEGRTIVYRAYTRAENLIHVGTYSLR